MQVKSITLNELINSLQKYKEMHPEATDYQVYFDSLHICGNLSKCATNILELY